MCAANLIKSHLKSLKRIQNTPFDRKYFLRLDKNENIIPFPEKIINEIRKNITSDSLSTYPQFLPLYKLMARWIGCKIKNIFITAGSDAAIKSVFEAYVNPKDKVLILDPTYAMYYVYAHMFQGALFKIEYDKDLNIAVEQILKLIKKERPKLVCIANPNSPTGTIIQSLSLKEIIKTANICQAIILIDEAYYPYYPYTVCGLIGNYRNLVIIRTFSKAFGFASVRLGYAIGHKIMIENLHKVRPMYETNAFATLLGKIAFDNLSVIKSNVRKTLEGKKYLEKQLEQKGIRYFKSFSNFININVGSYKKSCKIVNKMKKRKILIGGAYKHPCLKRCIRVTVGRKSDMKIFLDELQKHIN